MNNPNFYYFTGENEYELLKEVHRWKQAFAQKHGEENLIYLDGPTQTVSDLMDAVAVAPFIAEKRLVLCDGIPKVDKKQFLDVLSVMNPQTLLLVYASKIDKRLGIVKELESKAGEMKVFAPLSPAKLSAWIQNYVASRAATIAPQAAALLLNIVGNNQWTLSNELDKLCAYSKSISTAEVDLLAVQSGSQVIWRLTDLVGSRKPKEALRFFNEQIERGEDPYGMWAILLNMVKNIAAVWVCVQSGATSEKEIMDATGMNFFGVRGVLPLVKSLDHSRVRWLVNWSANADIELKTGGYKYTTEHTGEVRALAERIIVGCM